MVVFDRPCGENTTALALPPPWRPACPARTLFLFSLVLYRTNQIRTAPILTQIGAQHR